jgi:small-conductance mechanosensitive channel
MPTMNPETFMQIQSDITQNLASLIPIPRKLTAESIISAAIVLGGFYLASLLFKKVAEQFFLARKVDQALARFLIRAVRITLVALGVVTALGTLGIDVSAIVAGLGLTGLALGIALKDIVSNAVSGVMLLLFRPFRHNDRIKVADFEGSVCDIDLRYTHLRTDGKVIFVPNSMMFANAVSVLGTAATAASTKLVMPPAIESEPDAPTPEPSVEQELVRERERPNLLLAIADEKVAA